MQQELGAFRSFASKAAHHCPEIDEEVFFDAIARAFLDGIKKEMSSLFGPTKAANMLDPFKKSHGKTIRSR